MPDLTRVHSGALHGVDALSIEIEVNVGSGDPSIVIVGLPDTAVKESRDRVWTAIGNMAYSKPKGRTTINLAPADVRKEGPSFDLPIAVGIVALSEQLKDGALEQCAIVGELALDGRVRPVKGILSLTLEAKNAGHRAILVPLDNAREASLVEGIYVYGVPNLREAIDLLKGDGNIPPEKIDRQEFFRQQSRYDIDFNDVKGQAHVKRALEVAVAGGHNALLFIHFTTKRFCGISPLCPAPTRISGSPRRTRFTAIVSADRRNSPGHGVRRTPSPWPRTTAISGFRPFAARTPIAGP